MHNLFRLGLLFSLSHPNLLALFLGILSQDIPAEERDLLLVVAPHALVGRLPADLANGINLEGSADNIPEMHLGLPFY